MRRVFVGIALVIAVAGCASIPGLSATSTPTQDSIPQWEYKIERVDGDKPWTEERADVLGNQGWELAGVVHDTSSNGWYDIYTFKRRKLATPTPSPS